ncbi:M48 family metallopeptidase [Parablastomonas sp. CN1-191]|uniref:M48 family metallopeptidase n=1 Tax=Parablastomonas sp. CN1-191 TaxID=3400908 RepID=UPI003BF8CDBD
MIDWLRPSRPVPRNPAPTTLDVAGRTLPVILKRDARARRIVMRLGPDGASLRLTLPRWGSAGEALAFARSRTGWIAAQLAAVPAFVAIADGTRIPYLGRELTLRHDLARRRLPAIEGDALVVGGAGESLAPRLERWLRTEARRLIEGDLAHYSARAGLPPGRLLLSSARRRWGSCAPDGTIRLNWRLVMAPEAVRRSVVAHEVAHRLHFDHSPAFHAALAAIYDDDLRAADRWLKARGRTLYAPFG